ncbi:MAG: HD domain-containing protein [Desulfarculus sp.]|nr:HD domain-containing protein [Desulfarculus sp.]
MSRIRLLMVEDSEDDAILLLQELERGGLEPTWRRVETEEHMTLALREQPWDLVISDWSLPRFGGDLALKMLRSSGLDIPFLLVSGRIGEDRAVEMMRGGAQDYIPKDNLQRLVPAIRRELQEAHSRHRRRQAEEEVQRQLRRLASLRAIDRAITGSLDLGLTMQVFLEQVWQHFSPDAARVMLLDPLSHTLEPVVAQGFFHPHGKVLLGQNLTGGVALERRSLSCHHPDFAKCPPLAEVMPGEGFEAYMGVPMLAKGDIKGVLEVYFRKALAHDEDGLSFLEALATQGAIAIDSAQLFEGLQHSNRGLMLAYDSTLEGWARALELRDEETEEHCQRVTKLTVRLAQAMGISGEELLHMRRGALLHDVGKIGVPDAILLKPGPLNDEEWVIMRAHTTNALKILSPVAYLRPCLDIPHRHHEKWDGSGYPGGLKGVEIPLGARIFALVDVWDALMSDRPYRKAWPEEKVLVHVKGLVGTHFDPQVAEAFLAMIQE